LGRAQFLGTLPDQATHRPGREGEGSAEEGRRTMKEWNGMTCEGKFETTL